MVLPLLVLAQGTGYIRNRKGLRSARGELSSRKSGPRTRQRVGSVFVLDRSERVQILFMGVGKRVER